MEIENENLDNGTSGDDNNDGNQEGSSQQEGNEGSEANESNFDASAFSNRDESLPNNNEESGTDDSGGDSDENDNGSGSDDNSFDWGNVYEDEGNDGQGDDDGNGTDDNGQGAVENDNQGTDDNSGTDDGSGTEGANDTQFASLAEEMGLSATSKEEFKTQLQELEAENKRLREGHTGGFENDKTKRLSDLKAKTDEELVRLDLQKQGFNEDEISNAIDTYTDNGTIGIESMKIRKTIDRAINNEKNISIQNAKTEEAKLSQEREESIESLKGYMNEQTEMFGMKMAKDEVSLGKVQKAHTKYITSGKFMSEITESNEAISQASWMWKNRDVIFKALTSKGLNQGKKDILDDIGNIEVSSKGGFVDPGGESDFDANKFMGN